MRAYHVPFNHQHAYGLLMAIVEHSNKTLDDTYTHFDNALQMLDENPALVDLLHRGWLRKSFKEVRNLRILRIRKTQLAVSLGVPWEHKDVVISAWDVDYRGTAHEVMLKLVDDLRYMAPKSLYAKIVRVIQSSGTGKSRMVDKISSMRILLPMCLRENLGPYYFAYPLSDARVHIHMTGAPSPMNERECKGYFRSFLRSLFVETQRQVEQIFSGSAAVPYESIVMEFYKLFRDSSKRKKFYDAVIEQATAFNYSELCDVFQSCLEVQASLQNCCSYWPTTYCPILVSMDEIHVLYKKDTGADRDLYSILMSVLSEITMFNMSFIFLSTSMTVSKPTHSKTVAPSARDRVRKRFLPAPYTELPFDIHLGFDPLLPTIPHPLELVGTMEFTAKFYASYISQKEKLRTYDIIISITRIIREKLTGRRWPPDSPAVLNASSIAILSVRLILDLLPNTSSAKLYEEELVRHHLRLLYSVHADREVMVTGTSPEPLIAETSAQIMHRIIEQPNGEDVKYMDVWKLLVQLVNTGLLAQGSVGELIGRVFSILAMDRAIDRLPKCAELMYQTPVKVTDYYKALLTDDAWNTLRVSVPVNRSKLTKESAVTTFEKAFSEAYLHFSHYGKANSNSPLYDRNAWAWWLRGTAIYCEPDQKFTDRAIPIFFSHFDTVCQESVSLILEQDKAGQDASPSTTPIQSIEGLGLFSKKKRLPYIVAVHCYALTTGHGISAKRESQYNFRYEHEDKESPCYRIDFRGLFAYEEANSSLASQIRDLIDYSQNSLFKHHQREYGIPVVKRMLPVMDQVPAITDWYKTSDPVSEDGDDDSEDMS